MGLLWLSIADYHIVCFSFYRVDLINSDYRVSPSSRHVLLFVLVYRDYGHTTLYSNEIALKIYFYFSHILYNLDQLMYLFVDKSLVSYATMHQGCGQVPVLVLVLKYNFIST